MSPSAHDGVGDALDSRMDAENLLLALIAYGELSAFERTATDAQFAPSVADKAVLAKLAVAEFGNYELIADRLRDRGADVFVLMEKYLEPMKAFHLRTQPRDWHESLMKAFVSDGIVKDFYREISVYLDEGLRGTVDAVLTENGHAGYIVEQLRAAIGRDPRLGGRLALWGRRLVGEALSQAQIALTYRGGEVVRLLTSDVSDRPALEQLGEIFARITEAHSRRMNALDLVA